MNMWKVSGKKIFPRWQKIRQTAVKCKSQKPKDKPTHIPLCVVSEKTQSNGDNRWKQHARQQPSFWDDILFPNHTFCNKLLETVGIVGTAAFCLDLQHRHCRDLYLEKNGQPCIFSRLAYAMPFGANRKSPQQNLSETGTKILNIPQKEPEPPQANDVSSAAKELHNATMRSVAAIENSIGVMFLQQDEEQAFDFFKASAKLGCPKGLYNLGLCYETGRGTSKNLFKAARCYEMAASKDHSFALYNLAVFTLKGLGGVKQNFSEGMKLLKKAAEKNVPEAQLSLGIYYLEEENHKEAYKMFRASANNGNIDAKYYLGLCYENGWGVELNDLVATEMFAEAARKGHDEATLKLGNHYETGNFGMDPDTEFSMTLYNMLADKGHNGGKEAIQILNTKKSAWMSKSNLVQTGKKTIDGGTKKSTTVADRLPNTLHSSSSVPEFKNYSLYCKMDHSKSIVHSMLSLNDIQTELSVTHIAKDFKSIKYGIDFVKSSPVSFHIDMSQMVVANS